MEGGPLTTLSRRQALAGAGALFGGMAMGASPSRADDHINKNELYARLRGDPSREDGLCV